MAHDCPVCDEFCDCGDDCTDLELNTPESDAECIHCLDEPVEEE